MIRVNTVHHGVIEIDFDLDAIPLIRPFQKSSPLLRVEGTRYGMTYLVPLGELDLSRESITELNF